MAFTNQVIRCRKRPPRGYIVHWVHNRLKHNKSVLAIVVGEPGSGKSLGAFRLAELIDPTFNASRIVFNTTDFMDLIQSNLKRGSVIVFDEAGVGIPSAEWQSQQVKLFRFLLETFRFKQIITIFTVPDMSFIESGARKLIQLKIVPLEIDYTKKLCFLEPRLKVSTPWKKTAEPYFGHFRIKADNMPMRILKRFAIGLPSKKLMEDYDKAKIKFSEELYKEIHIGIRQTSIAHGKNVLTKDLTEMQKKFLELYPTTSLIGMQKYFNLKSVSSLSQMRNILILKGYDLPTKRGKRTLPMGPQPPASQPPPEQPAS